MKPALPFLSLILLASGSVEAQSPDLTVQLVPYAIEYRVSGPTEPFFAAVILSLSPKLAPYAHGVPPLLTDFAILGIGIGNTDAGVLLAQAEQGLPAGIFIYAQGVTLDGAGFGATPVRDFVLDVTVPGR
ncbi:MAG: hypothetical protein ABIP94_07145 [Planctomycetota bacterium]